VNLHNTRCNNKDNKENTIVSLPQFINLPLSNYTCPNTRLSSYNELVLSSLVIRTESHVTVSRRCILSMDRPSLTSSSIITTQETMKTKQFRTNYWTGKDTFPYSTHFSAMTESVSVLLSLRSQNILKCKNKHTSTWGAERKTPLGGTRPSRIHTAIWI